MRKTRTTFWFDPGCPWTWVTSRWLVDAASRNDATIQWRSFSLPYVNRDSEVPASIRATMATSVAAHRLIHRTASVRGDDAVGRLYEALGFQWHVEGAERTIESVVAAGRAVGLGDEVLAAVEDQTLDAGVEASTEEALTLAGPDVGSPVLQIAPGAVAFHGPLLDRMPGKGDSQELWEAVRLLSETAPFYELKRGRPDRPKVPAAA